MHRAQLLLEEWQYEALKSLSDCHGRSVSEIVREILGRHLQKRQQGATGKLGKLEGVADDPSDLGEDHDTHLYRPRRKS